MKMNPFYEQREGKLQVGITHNITFPEHLHNHVEMLYVLEGTIEVSIGWERQTMNRGDCAVIFPDQIHSYLSATPNQTLIPIFDVSMAGPFLHSLQKYYPAHPFLLAQELPADVPLALDRLNAPGITEDMPLGSAWIQVILASIFPLLELKETGAPETEDLVCRLVHYIMEHFKEPLSLDILSHEMHVNKYYLSHVFASKLQMSFPQYLNRIRLEYALTSILSCNKTLTCIWEEAGFNSQRSFNRVFQSVMGMTPIEYRKGQEKRDI